MRCSRAASHSSAFCCLRFRSFNLYQSKGQKLIEATPSLKEIEQMCAMWRCGTGCISVIWRTGADWWVWTLVQCSVVLVQLMLDLNWVIGAFVNRLLGELPVFPILEPQQVSHIALPLRFAVEARWGQLGKLQSTFLIAVTCSALWILLHRGVLIPHLLVPQLSCQGKTLQQYKQLLVNERRSEGPVESTMSTMSASKNRHPFCLTSQTAV